ncbi:MAG TPA: hypothetical protein VEC06_02245 [Paucimonas sp.]|nr:hypothetical protein [Paucimonas sp.]
MMRSMVAALFLAAAAQAGAADDPEAWRTALRLVGEWQGKASGQAGEGTASRRYIPVLGGRFLHETNTSTYPPQEKNPKGEVHEHWSMLSYDKNRKTVVLRQFHGEGFVNTYRLGVADGQPGRLVFESESFENFSNAWRARETYEFVTDDEFIETFELAAPGKPYQVYSRNIFKRVGVRAEPAK